MSEVRFGGVPLPLPIDETITVIPGVDSQGHFGLTIGKNVTTFTDFAQFTAALDTALKAGAELGMFYASGTYDQATLRFTAETLSARLRQ